MGPVARKILDACGMFRDEAERFRLLDAVLFKYNYRKTIVSFRDHAAETLAAFAGPDTWVVTNAHTEPVRAKIALLEAQLGDKGALAGQKERVIGLARKQVVDDADPRTAHLPADLRLPGLDRPVLPRRPHYLATLDALRDGRPWDRVVVVGDIFELDLSLPLAVGARVVLAANRFTPSWERAYVSGHPRGHVLFDLRELVEVVNGG